MHLTTTEFGLPNKQRARTGSRCVRRGFAVFVHLDRLHGSAAKCQVGEMYDGEHHKSLPPTRLYRANKDVTRVKLLTTTPYSLCLTCHADKNAADIKGTVHKPAVRDCLKCHDPHSSDNKFQLVKATAGDQ